MTKTQFYTVICSFAVGIACAYLVYNPIQLLVVAPFVVTILFLVAADSSWLSP